MTQLSALESKIAARLKADGALTIADFMALAVGDREHGYYAAAAPFGVKGDFITAPEISQIFGEIIGIWIAAAWDSLGRPASFILAEGGPGRGTLSDDILRALAKIAPQCLAAAELILLETSPALREQQRQKLAKYQPMEQSGIGEQAAGRLGRRIKWTEDFAALAQAAGAKPLIFIANELLDALPVRQFQKSAQGWQERLIKADRDGRLHFALSADALPCPPFMADAAFTELCARAPSGAIAEVSPARCALIADLSRLIARNRGLALLIDYGALAHGLGDTLQAVSRHAYAPILENIGRSDISSHVDFAALTAAAKNADCQTKALTQREFLRAMGLEARAARLCAGKSAAAQAEIAAAAARLASRQAMGELFKLLCIADLNTPMPVFQD